MVARVEAKQVSQLELNRQQAITRLRAYLQSPEERAIHAAPGREHQGDMMDDTLKFFESGKTAGYIDSATGTGKTVIAASIIKALGMNTIVVSPRGTVLDETKKTIEGIDPDANVTNYDGRSKSLAGNVINTTLNSLGAIADIGFVAENTQLIILDEFHEGTLGRERHKLWRKFPNALIVALSATADASKLEGLEDEGLIDSDERWIGAFTEEITSLSREEAWERRAIVPADIHLVRTHTEVGDIQATVGGRYDKAKLERYLNQKRRNLMALAAIAGPDKLPAGVKFPDDLQHDLEDIHAKIKGKRTVFFGLSINHIRGMAEMLREAGVSAVAVDGTMSRKTQKLVEDAHKLDPAEPGSVQVILTDQLLGVGWNSPPTEVGVFANLTQSGIELSQEFGRILRLSEETGKERAIAVQFVDDHEDRAQRPVLLTDLLDPDYVIRGSRSSFVSDREDRKPRTKQEKDELPVVTIHGMHIKGIVEQARTDARLLRRFEGATVEEMNSVFAGIITDVQKKYDDTSVLTMYREIADIVPKRLVKELQQTALKAVQSTDLSTRNEGIKAFIFLNMRGIFSIVDPYFTGSEAQNEDVIQSSIATIFEHIDEIDPEKNVTFQLRGLLGRGELIPEIASWDGFKPAWVRERKSGKIARVVDTLVHANGGEALTDSDVFVVSENLSEQTGYKMDALLPFVTDRHASAAGEEEFPEDDYVSGIVFEAERARVIEEVLVTLAEREAGVVRLRHGLTEDGQERTLDEIGLVYGVTRERIRQIESKTMSKLRHPQRSGRFRDFVNLED